MNRSDLERRTKEFALSVMRIVSKLTENSIGRVISYRLMKSGTSIGANYREAGRAESKADFVHKLALVEKEAAETMYWLELLNESHLIPGDKLEHLMDECYQLLSIFSAAGKTAKKKENDNNIILTP